MCYNLYKCKTTKNVIPFCGFHNIFLCKRSICLNADRLFYFTKDRRLYERNMFKISMQKLQKVFIVFWKGNLQ
nr:MAG TPA: hypothetical protein [Caudoviricetes sp.]